MKKSQASLVVFLVLAVAPAMAHPVPKENHDRYITVCLQKGATPRRLVVGIVYRLEADETTVHLDDMKPYRDEVKVELYINKPLEYYGHFTRIYADIFARKLEVKANGKPLTLALKSREATLKDEKGEALGHLRCTFVYEAELPILAGRENSIHVYDASYLEQEGQIHWTLLNDAGVKIGQQNVPDAELNKIHPLERPLDFDKKLRKLSLRFAGGEVEPQESNKPPESPTSPDAQEPAERASAGDHEGFLKLFRELRQQGTGLFLLLVFFAGLGAAHALTPGHGKTLVAAYLVGEHGTIWHAIVLGVVTTITHTGVVLILAAILFFLPDTLTASARDSVRTGLGLGMGLLVACMGLWLLLRRLSGRVDHVHLGGGHHHHHRHGHSHHHGIPDGQRGELGWWGIVFLGMTGGLVPCWDAIVILATVVGTSEFWFALPALLAFSAGLAGVLVLIGILVVKFRSIAGSHWGEGRLIRSLPLVSAAVITVMGLWLCSESVHHP